MDLDELRRVTVRPLRAELWWRHCYIPSNPDDQDPLFVSPATPSRWRTAEGTLYLGDLRTTVWCEYLRNTADQVARADPTGGLGLGSEDEIRAFAREPLDVVPRGLWRVEVDFDRVADFTGGEGQQALASAGIDAEELLRDDFGPCPDIAERYVDFGWQALLAPSAALREGTCVAAFRPHHPDQARWTQVQKAARPTVLHAYLTRFHANERPAWLPNRP
jgi:hypothetical protein